MRKKRRKKYRLKKFGLLYNLIVITIVWFVISTTSSVYAYYRLSTITVQTLADIEVSEELQTLKRDYDVLNIALFGVDSRDDSYDFTRADAIMILSYNFDTSVATVSSVARDTYLYLGDDYGFDKINHAYSFGGPELTMTALNENFDLDIQDYITINFDVAESIIDELGGVTLTVLDTERAELNRIIEEMNADDVTQTHLLTDSGTQTLSGKQAVAYMRIRAVGNGDFDRMQRQRSVMSLLVDELLNSHRLSFIHYIDNFLPHVKTSLLPHDILTLGIDVLLQDSFTLTQHQLPYSDMSYAGRLNDGYGYYYIIPKTLSANVVSWHEAIYEMPSYTPTTRVSELSASLSEQTGLYD